MTDRIERVAVTDSTSDVQPPRMWESATPEQDFQPDQRRRPRYLSVFDGRAPRRCEAHEGLEQPALDIRPGKVAHLGCSDRSAQVAIDFLESSEQPTSLLVEATQGRVVPAAKDARFEGPDADSHGSGLLPRKAPNPDGVTGKVPEDGLRKEMLPREVRRTVRECRGACAA